MESKAAKDEKGLQPESNPKIIYLTDEARAERVAKCPYCGTEVSTDAKKCDHCGRVIEISSDSVDKPLQDRAVNFDSLGYIKSALASKYQVIEEIASTDTSTVFRAIHLQLRREVALKVLLKKIAQDRDFTDRFHRRARAIDRLSQNNIITVLDEGVDNGLHYMAMEYLKGVDLQRKVSEDGPISAEELVSILMPAIGGLGHAHSNGIIHGNLKCGSIFLHDDGRIILFGFGIPYLTKANLISFKRDSNSLEYISPEEANGKSADGRSDIYSLGVIMYYSLTGRFPYTGMDRASTITAILGHQYVPINKLRQIPQWLERIVDKCLQRDISKRVQSCAELLGLLNVRPPAQATQFGPGVQAPLTAKPAEPTKEKPVDAPSKIDEAAKPPIVSTKPPASDQQKGSSGEGRESLEKPADDETLVEPPTVEFTPKEEAPVRSFKEEHAPPKPKAAVEQPAKPETKTEMKVEKKGKSKASIWIIAFVVVGILGAALALVLTNRESSVNGSAAPASELKQAETTSEQSTQPATDQEKTDNAVQPTDKTAGQAESSTPTTQEETPSIENNTPAPAQGISKTQETSAVEKDKSASSKSVSKVKVNSDRTVQSVPASKSRSEGSKTTSTPAPPVVQLVAVPDLTGTQLNVAKSILSLNGLKVGAVSRIPDPANDGMVVRQVPKPGTQLTKGSTVNLIIGSK
jgi:serine/threonine protein kinase